MSLGRYLIVVSAIMLSLAAQPGHSRTEGSAEGSAEEGRAVSITEERQPCRDVQPEGQLLFGDLHVHTRYSLDASTQDTRTGPADAYRFAQGQTLGVQPWRADGTAMRSLKLSRPLDFAAVTDHAELLGEVEICQSPQLEGYGSWQCRLYRRFPRAAFFIFNTASSMAERLGFCGDDGALCRKAALGPWQDIQQAADSAYDRSEDCKFTTFVAYEWTGASDSLANLHRNVIFRNGEVPQYPLSFIDAPSAPQLWDGLDEHCTDAEGLCDVLVIPHNSNLSDGYMFQLADPGADAGRARQRQRLERLVEIMQHKGSSECYYDPLNSADELCEFEQLPYGTFADKFLGKLLPPLSDPPSASAGFLRDVWRDGLDYERQAGFNPLQFGVIASTDTHISAPGAVDEKQFLGHGGAGAPAAEGVPAGLPDDLEFNPGGLAAVWAESNSRDAIFAALRRREAYATSGPRIPVRFYAGWELPDDLCQAEDYARQGYRHGVPMGGNLEADGESSSPVFNVFAAMDPGQASPRGLQAVQIIKGSVDESGRRSEQVFTVAGELAADTNLPDCGGEGRGAPQFCVNWRDPDFDPQARSYYYARVLESPSCRWSQHRCLAAGVNCQNPETIAPGFEACCSEAHRPVIMERAWTSPVWVTPSTP